MEGLTKTAPGTADEELTRLRAKYSALETPLDVSFRDMLKLSDVRGRVVHHLHHYPAKLLVNIPAFFLASSLSKAGELILDPFCGSGTVLLEAVLSGRIASGADANPLARLIASTKVMPVDTEKLTRAARTFFLRLPDKPKRLYPDVVNLHYWFYPHVARDLLRLLECSERISSPEIRNVFLVTLSSCIKDVSLADPRLSVPVRLRNDQYSKGHWLHAKTIARLSALRRIDVIQIFSRRLAENIERLRVLRSLPTLGTCTGVDRDARNLSRLGTETVDMIITSPPYLGAQKYVRASSLSLTWLELCRSNELRKVEDLNIGREHYPKRVYRERLVVGLSDADRLLDQVREKNPLRAHIAAQYLVDMRAALREAVRVLKRRRYLVLVAGASSIGGLPFSTPHYLLEIANDLGLQLELHLVDTIRSRALMTKRHRTAGLIHSESILLLRKR